MERYLDVLSSKWVARIVWYLLEPDGPRRFADLRRSLDGVSAKVLTDNLRMLERAGIVQRIDIVGNRAQVEYWLTPRGAKLKPVFRAMEDAAAELFPAG